MYQLGKHLVHPYFLLMAFLGLLLVNLWYRRKEARSRLLALTAIYVALLIYSSPLASRLARRSLEGQYPPLDRRPADAQAIVVISGGKGVSVLRCETAARLYRQGEPCPVLISCAPDTPSLSQFEIMRERLVVMGVRPADILGDKEAQNTYENAVQSRAALGPRGVDKIILVTDAMHMPRAAACFRKQGFDVIPAGCDDESSEEELGGIFDFLPRASSVLVWDYVAQEWLGSAWYKLRGRS
jgi:uncharacterized SAM-binding protein YcdF (DUF218 family)